MWHGSYQKLHKKRVVLKCLAIFFKGYKLSSLGFRLRFRVSDQDMYGAPFVK